MLDPAVRPFALKEQTEKENNYYKDFKHVKEEIYPQLSKNSTHSNKNTLKETAKVIDEQRNKVNVRVKKKKEANTEKRSRNCNCK